MPAKVPPIVLIAFDGVEPLDIAGPASVFAQARRLRPAAPEVVIASPRGGDVATSAGFAIAATTALADLGDRLDTILVAGGTENGLRDALFAGGAAAWLGEAARRARRIGSVCTGAFALAAAGLLDGRRATTHWGDCARLQRLCPTARIEPDALFVIDGEICTSAGVSAGIDLALALVETDHGAAVAAEIARTLVLFLRRPGGQSQFSAGLAAQGQAGDRMRELIAWIVDHPQGELTVPALARRVGMSERNFSRVFTRETGQSPAHFVVDARIARAKFLLESTRTPLARVADRSGLGSIDSLQRVFRERVGVTPRDYRARFTMKSGPYARRAG
jgi:transcriptional regulator GlxA family with amidase domain